MSRPFFTVIIPAYKTEKYLPKTIRSVLNQTFTDFEIIVVDDCSPVAQAPYVPADDSRIRVIRHSENRGVGGARNTGIRNANGEYVVLLDSDDCWRAEKLEAQAQFLKANPQLDVLFCDFIHLLDDGTPERWRGGLAGLLDSWGVPSTSVENGRIFTQSLMPYLIQHTSFMHPSSMVVRKNYFEKCGYFDETYKSIEDLEMWIRLTEHAQVGLVDRVLVEVLQRPDSLGHDQEKMSRYMVQLYETLPARYPNLSDEVQRSIQKRLATEYHNLGYAEQSKKNRSLARSHYLRSFQLGRKTASLSFLKTFLPMGLIRLGRWFSRRKGATS